MSSSNRIDDSHCPINKGETAVFLNCIPDRTVHVKGEKDSSVMINATFSVVMEGTKLPLFVIFKDTPRGYNEKQLSNVFFDGSLGCVQAKWWMDDRKFSIWYEDVYEPNISSCEQES